ncbi:glycosyltransferase [uncultured Desulfuromusa sp.]|uniref:glycosyltransferase family 2 protein n=1 Tax=uncultured Desulfuromusa sp. TaxID=219183 RepID=UPI002AA78652|nr:glycosyltransferase [uncultured Desulfuromusa sp.]
MFISICILTFNRCEILEKLLESLSLISYSSIEIIVVDNCSQDNTENIVLEKFCNIIYHKTENNIGVAARNIALSMAKGDVIITIDDDIFGINDTTLVNISNYFSNDKTIGALNFKVLDAFTGDICNWIHHKKEENFHDKEFLTYEITEGAVAFNRKALTLSGYYPAYFFLSHEGPDLALRIMDSGFDVRYSPLVEVLHSHAQAGRKSWFRYYYDTRNQFLLAMRNFPVFYSIRFILKGAMSTFIYSLRDGFLWYWLKGVFDGLCAMIKYSSDRSVLSCKTMSLVYEIDRQRPSLLYMLKKRIFRKEMRL